MSRRSASRSTFPSADRDRLLAARRGTITPLGEDSQRLVSLVVQHGSSIQAEDLLRHPDLSQEQLLKVLSREALVTRDVIELVKDHPTGSPGVTAVAVLQVHRPSARYTMHQRLAGRTDPMFSDLAWKAMVLGGSLWGYGQWRECVEVFDRLLGFSALQLEVAVPLLEQECEKWQMAMPGVASRRRLRDIIKVAETFR